jgi:hypothetical protein
VAAQDATLPEAVVEQTEAAAPVADEAKVEDVARTLIDRAKKKDKRSTEVTEATREFWETWAENKATREPDAISEVVEDREEKKARPARGEREERRGRDRGRGRGDKATREEKPSRKDKDDERSSARGKRDTTVDTSARAAAVADGNQARLFVSLGKKHGVSADDLRNLLAGPIGGDTSQIGSVSLRDSHAHVRVPEEHVEAIIAGVHGTLHNDHNVTVERARA